MKVAVMQPYFFPYIGYWQLISAVDTFVIYDDVNFIKKGFINRNSILINSASQLFTLGLVGASQNKLINEIEIGDNRDKLLKSVELSYKKSPNFDEVFPVIKNILTLKERNLAIYIGDSLQIISNYLEIDTKFIYSSSIEKNNNLKGEEKIIDIAKKLKAKTYLNAIGGKDLYKIENFNKENIELKFLKTKNIEYKQLKNNFVPNLSIIDVMMFNSRDSVKRKLERYELL